jgi:hypothetical protein
MKRLFKNIQVKYLKFMRDGLNQKKTDDLTSYEQKAMSIFRKMLRHKDSKFTIAPLSGKKYIVNQELGIFIMIEDSFLEITNHIYHYEIKLQYSSSTKLHKLFNTRVEEDAISYEKEIKSNIKMSLDTILTKVSTK